MSAAPQVRPAPTEVVVGILDDDGAVRLVEAALAAATTRRAAVRVVRVLPPGSGQPEVLRADTWAYDVTRAAGERGATPPSLFEVVVGDALEVLLDRARDAVLLVVGADRPTSDVARRCLGDAACDVLVVDAR